MIMNRQTPKARRKRVWIPAVGAALLLSSILALYIFISSYDINNIKPFVSRVVKEKTGRDLLIHGPIRIEMGISPWLMAEHVALRNAPWGSHPDMVVAEQMKLQVNLLPLLRKRIEVRSVSLMGAAILLETDRAGRSNFSLEGSKKSPSPGRTWPEPFRLGGVYIEKGLLSFRDGKTGQSFSVAVDRLEARRAADGVVMELEAEGRYASEHFRLQGLMGTIESLIDPEEPWRMDVTARAFGGEVRMDGFLQKPLSLEGLVLRIKGAGKSTNWIANLFGFRSLPELGPFQIEGEISGNKDRRFHISGLKFTGKQLDAEGELALTLKQQGPEVRGSLSFKRLDISSFLKREGDQKNRPALGEGKTVFSSIPIPFTTLGVGSLAVELELKAERVVLLHTLLSELKTKIRIRGNRFTARPLQFKAGGGGMNGALDVSLQEGTATLVARAGINEMDVKTFLKEKNVLGTAAADIDLVAQGSSVAELMGGLNGRVFFALSGLKFDNNSVKPLGSQFGTVILQAFAPASKDANTTEINCLVGGFDITEGLAKATTLLADTHEAVVVGKGRLNLREETLDLSIRPYPKKGIGGVSFSLTELTKAFKLGGTLAEPSLRIDPLRSVLTIGKMVGGMVLLGPAGAAVVFAGQAAGEGDLCLAAIEQAKQIGTIPGPLTEEEEKSEALEQDRGVKDVFRSVEKNFRKLFTGQSPEKKAFNVPDGGGY